MAGLVDAQPLESTASSQGLSTVSTLDAPREPFSPLEVSTPVLSIVLQEPLFVKAPELVINLQDPLEITTPEIQIVLGEPLAVTTPELVINLQQPLEVRTPSLDIYLAQPLVVSAPTLLVVIEEDDKESDEQSDSDQSSTAPGLGSKTVTAQLCVGDYTLHSAGAVGEGGGPDGKPVPTMRVGTPVMAKARLSSDSCGEFLTMNSQGKSIQLARQHGDENVYVGEMKMPDGVTRILQLTCGRDLNMHGVLFARDANLKLRRPLWLRPVNTTTTTLASCVK